MIESITKEKLASMLEFMGNHLDGLDEEYTAQLQKMIDNFETAWKGAKEDNEKLAYLNIIYCSNVRELMTKHLRKDTLSADMLAELSKLPSMAEAQSIMQPYTDDQEKTKNKITEEQLKYAEHMKELEIFKGIAFGDNPTTAKKKVEEYDRKAIEAMRAQQSKTAA